jgi:biopolymer transport protein ExbD
MELDSPKSFTRPRAIVVLCAALAVLFAIWIEGTDALTVQFAMFLIVIALPLAGAGIWFSWRALTRRLRIDTASRRTPQIFPGVPIRNVLPWKPQKLATVMKDLPSFGIFTSILLNILMFIFMIFMTPGTPAGLMIPMTLRDPGAGLDSPRTETLGVYVAAGGQFYVNGQAVARDQLGEKLRQELGKRVVWTVYVEADDDVEFARLNFVFDTIKGLGAEVYWITPRVREEWSGPSNRR